ncbi:MAG: hypothetical protein AB1734_10525 [Elusimicrobiota bacterium]|jgi:hypothetical protein
MKKLLIAAVLLGFAAAAYAHKFEFDGGVKNSAALPDQFREVEPPLPHNPGLSNRVESGMLMEGAPVQPSSEQLANPPLSDDGRAYYVILPSSHNIYNFWVQCGSGFDPNPWNVCLSYQIEAYSAGHTHTAGVPDVDFVNGNYPKDFCRYNLPLGTRVHWDFRAPFFGSRIVVTMRATGSCTGSISHTVDAKVNLVGMAETTDGTYLLTGQTDAHEYNHYATTTTLYALRKIAWEYRQAYPTAPALRYNDFSLPWGGLFDIGPRPNHPEWQFWHPPHSSHRWGWQADIESADVPIGNQPKLLDILRKNGARVLSEGSHWHLDFTPKADRYYEEELRCY